VVDRVVVHIGQPKSATSYLQTILWSNRDALRAQGVVVPGEQRRDHLWSSRLLREDPQITRAPEHQQRAWDRVTSELASASGTGLISHEFFAAASSDQARRMVADLAPAEVEVVVTARDPLSLFTASWQESLKNGATVPMADYGDGESRRSTAIWDWRTLDLRLVLERWTQAVAPERVHVVVLDPGADRDDVWRRFAGVLGVDPEAVDLDAAFPNSSMGVAQAETLRRLNERLTGFTKAFDKGVYLRSYLGDELLVTQGGDKFWPTETQVAECRRRAALLVEHLAASGVRVDGDAAHLLVPDTLPARRVPSSVTDAEVADVALDLVAAMLHDVRRLRGEVAEARRSPEAGGAGGDDDGPGTTVRRLLGRLPRPRGG
jgi:hypothetical protein